MKELEIRLSGTGGQGLVLGGRILARALVLEGFLVAQSQSYEPTARGGLSRSDLVASVDTVDYPLATALDFLVILDQIAVPVSKDMIKAGGLVLVDSGQVTEPPSGDHTVISLPFAETAKRVGSLRTANTVALGALVEAGGLCRGESLERAIRETMSGRNLDIGLAGAAAGQELALQPAASPQSSP